MRFVLPLLLLLLTGGCGSSVPTLKPLATDAVVLAFGDSLTYGTGAPAGDSYPDVLQALIGRTVVRSGVPGEVTAESLQRLPEVLENTNPQLLLLCIGGNDFLRMNSERRVASNIREMIKLAQSKGTEVVLIGVPKFGLTLSPPELYSQIAEEFNIPYESQIMHKILVSPKLRSDDVHPNTEGYRVFAAAIEQLLKKAKAI